MMSLINLPPLIPPYSNLFVVVYVLVGFLVWCVEI